MIALLNLETGVRVGLVLCTAGSGPGASLWKLSTERFGAKDVEDD